MDIMTDLEKFLLDEIAVDVGKKSLAPDEDLLSQGIIDSLGIMKLVAFLEKNFKVKIDNDDIIPENFQNLNALKTFVEKKLSK
jgi:acyl carrier protein